MGDANDNKQNNSKESQSNNNNDYKSLKSDRKTIAAIASATVDGYLRNASRRHRVPAAEGGRGTRRKLAMVTSAMVAQEAPTDAIVDADDEWDEVDLPAIPVKKQETVKTDAMTANDAGVANGMKGERGTSELPIVKDEPNTTSSSNASRPPTGAKTETVIVDDHSVAQNAAASALQPFNVDDTPLPQGARPPLIEQPRRSMWRHGNDPAYEALREQRDLLAAQRRSDRIQRTSYAIVELTTLLERGRLLWREAHHPAFLRALLMLVREPSEDPDAPSAKKTKTESAITATKGRGRTSRKSNSEASFRPAGVHVLSAAVTSAKRLVAEAAKPEHTKPSLAPAWVTPSRDTVKNKTTEAVCLLLKAINDTFTLVLPEGSNDSSENERLQANGDGEAPPVDKAAAAMSDWAAPLELQCMMRTLKERRRLGPCPQEKIGLAHTLYFSVVFLALAAMAKLDCRLVMAKQLEREKDEQEKRDGTRNEEESGATLVASAASHKLEKMSIFVKEPKKRGRKAADGATEGDEGKEGEQVKSKKQPSSCFWVEVWSVERNSFIAVNPCVGCTTLWGAPYTFSIAGDVIVDATARYTSKYSTAFSFNRRLGRVNAFGFLWKDKLTWDDVREISEVLLEPFCKDATAKTRERLPRERKQLESLAYSEPIPTTLAALHRHPLFVIESDLARHEGVYPKDTTTTVGRVKGHTVYKRSAVVSLRSRDGWLREGRSLLDDDDAPYKEVPPPASRPFAAPSMFFGRWQTKPFEPLPLRHDNSIPHHGRTSWYILLDAVPPPGIVHLTHPQIARVARRMQLDFGLAVVGFHKRQIDENRRGHWEAVIDGVAVRAVDEARLMHAYKEWMQLVQEKEAAKRRDRAMHWWQLLIQRMLAMERLRTQYLDGAARGSLPTM